MKTSPKRYENVDWQRVRKVLVFRATQLSLASGQSPDGAPPGHLADEVITDFFLHPDGLDWEPKKGRLETCLRRMLDAMAKYGACAGCPPICSAEQHI